MYHVYELPFLANGIIKEGVFKGADGKEILYKFCKPTSATFVAGAVSALFPNLPEYQSDNTMKRKPPKLRIVSATKSTAN